MKMIILICFIVYFVSSSKIPAQVVTNGVLEAEEFDCPTGIRLVENECNGCFCTSEGELACTIHECPENLGKDLGKCTLSTSWQEGCNKCWCITIGKVCTDRQCKNEYENEIVIK